jgi:hypothetical protein
MAGTNFKVKNGLEIQSGTVIAGGGAGTNGQVLSSTGTGVQWVNASSGSGDVVGPASSTDNAVVRFDGTTGKLIQNSTAATISDSGNADFLSTKSDYFDIDTTATTTAFAAGRILWNDANKTASLCFDSDSVQTDLGQSIYAYVTNADSTTINLGDAVYLFGATGNRASVKKASSSAESTSSKTLGLAAMSIAPNNTGMIITQGTLGGLNLGSYTAGDTIYLGTTAGSITNVKPSAPTNLVVIGVVERANNGNGQILVKVQNGFELSELHDVLINGTLASGNTLIYDATASLWKNASLTAGTGISVTNGAASITIANTGVTSVTGTSPVSSSGGTTPAISLASGYGDTQNPYASKTANYFLAAPNGSAGSPTFRAIVAADIPTLNQSTTGNAATASALQTARNINGVSFNGTADITVTAAANTLTGTTLASGVTASSLTSVGTLTGLTVTRTTSGDTGTFTNTSTTNQSANVNAVSDNSTAISLRVFGSAAGSYGMLAANSTALYTTATSLNLCADNASGVIKFSTGSSVPERMRLDSSGNLGLGTSSPTQKIMLGGQTGATSTPLALQFSADWSNGYVAEKCKIYLYNGGGTGLWGFAIGPDNDIQYHSGGAGNTNGQHKWYTGNTETMRLNASGNLGIGTASPSTKLHVIGDIRASGVYVGNGSSGSYTKGFGGVQTTTSTSTPTGGSSGDFTLIY